MAGGSLSPASDPDVLIVGGGVVGLFCAYYLRLAGAQVVVVERGSVGGPQSCSHGNTGFFGTQGAAPFAGPFDAVNAADAGVRSWLGLFERDKKADAGPLWELKRRSLELLRELDFASIATTGVVLAFKTRQAFERLRDGPIPWQVLSSEEAHELELDVYGALYNPDAGFVRAPDFVIELARKVESMGVRICEHTEVLGAKEIVIAAGAWSAGLARERGIELALQAVKGYSVTVKTPPGAPRVPVLLSEGHVAIAPLGDRLRLGGVMDLSGLDDEISPSHVDSLRRTAHEYLPGLDFGESLEVWAGFRSCTPDSLPFLGRAPGRRNLSFACGHGHIGMGTAPASGKLMAQLLLGEPTDMSLDPFRIDRW